MAGVRKLLLSPFNVTGIRKCEACRSRAEIVQEDTESYILPPAVEAGGVLLVQGVDAGVSVGDEETGFAAAAVLRTRSKKTH